MMFQIEINVTEQQSSIFGVEQPLRNTARVSKKDSDIHRLMEFAHNYLSLIEPENIDPAQDYPTPIDLIDGPKTHTNRQVNDAVRKAESVIKTNVIRSLHTQGIDVSMDGEGVVYQVDLVRDDNVDKAMEPLLFRKMGGHKSDVPRDDARDLARERVQVAVSILDVLAGHMYPQVIEGVVYESIQNRMTTSKQPRKKPPVTSEVDVDEDPEMFDTGEVQP